MITVLASSAGQTKDHKIGICCFSLRDRPFNLQEGRGRAMGFFSFRIFFFGQRKSSNFFFVAQSAQFFFQNLTLGNMTKTLNQIIFFPPPK